MENSEDNCPVVSNPSQEDADGDGVGDACEEDCDGDGILDNVDVCPCNLFIEKTDFRAIQSIELGENKDPSLLPPVWKFKNEGQEIQQEVNSAPGIAIGEAKLAGVHFEGTMYVAEASDPDDDWIGVVFSYQVDIQICPQTCKQCLMMPHASIVNPCLPGQLPLLPADGG